MLADNVFERSSRPAVENFERQERGARILLSREDDATHLRHLGVAELDGDRVVADRREARAAAERVAVTGIYFYDPTVFEFLPTLDALGARRARDHGREQLVRRARGRWSTTSLEGFWGDAGESIDAYYAVNDFVRRNGANK